VYYHDRHPLADGGNCKGAGLHLGPSGGYFQYLDGGGGRNKSFFTVSLRENPHAVLPAPSMALKVLVARPDGRIDRGWMFVPSNYNFVGVTYPYNFDPISNRGWDQRLSFGVYTVLVESLSGGQVVCTGFVNVPPK
jgi:hypothetical protein